MLQYSYKIYPSVLNKFQDFLDYAKAAEQPWNKVRHDHHLKGEFTDREIGDYILTPDEKADELELELIDCINRVPHDPIEAADRGTAFNEIVDCLMEHRNTSNPAITLKSGEFFGENAIRATINGFEFYFSTELCKKASEYFKKQGCIPQYLCEGDLNTRYGLIQLYGYADEIGKGVVYDIKTTKSYEFMKYMNNWQKNVYSYCLTESGEMDVRSFQYTIYELRGGTSSNPIISAYCYKEDYTYDHKRNTEKLTNMCERFIEWLERNREKITDRKIFGGEEH